MNIREWQKEIHECAKEHGWYETERSFPELLALMHSELSEALEEYRDGNPNAYVIRDASAFPQYEHCYIKETDTAKWGDKKPEGIGIELADCVIRILDTCEHMGIDMENMIRLKHVYNQSRTYRHGGKKV